MRGAAERVAETLRARLREFPLRRLGYGCTPTSDDWRTFEQFLFVRSGVCLALLALIPVAAHYSGGPNTPQALWQIFMLVLAATALGIPCHMLARVRPCWISKPTYLIYLRHTTDVALTTIGVSLIHYSNAFVPIALYALIVTDTAVTVSARGAFFMAALAATSYACVTLLVDTSLNPQVLPAGSIPTVIFNAIFLAALAAHTAILIDATRRERLRSDGLLAAKEAIRRSEEHFRALIEKSSDLVAILAPEGNVRYVSPAHRRVLGYESDDLLGRNVFDFVHPDDCSRVLQRFAEGMRMPGAGATAEFRFRHKDGSWRMLEGIATNRADDPLIAGAVVNSRDVTDRKCAEEKLAAQAVELRRKQEELEAFVYTVTHDLKNPVNAIVLLADLVLARGGFNSGSEDRSDLERILRLAGHTEDMLRDLLGFFRATSVPEEPGWIDLEPLIERVIESLRPQIAAKGVRVDVKPLPKVWGQREKLQHVIANLVGNAVKYVPANRGEVVLFGSNGGSTVRVSVDDNGIGVAEPHRGRIFELFGRVPSDEQLVDGKPVEGTGVGLAIVKRIVQAHGGSVGVDDRPGGGSRFIVQLPAGPSVGGVC